MTEQQLTDLVKGLAATTENSVAVVLMDPLNGSRARWVIDSSDDLVNAAVTLLCAAAGRLSTAAADCEGCASKRRLVDAALSALGFPPELRGAGGDTPAQTVVH